ncbi:MAG: glycosyltransferase family protein [bacterium]|nr:glycosyltransferase family protein [bacterium]
MNIAAIIQARMNSSRLPNKILLELIDKTLLEHIIERVKKVSQIHQIIIATTERKIDDQVEKLALKSQVKVFRGSEEDVLDRFIKAAQLNGAEIIIRITGDNPLIDNKIIQDMIAEYEKEHCDYITVSGMPLGTSCELVTLEVLKKIYKENLQLYHLEHVTFYIKENLEKFKTKYLKCEEPLKRPNYRLTVDTVEDYNLMKELYQRFYKPNEIIDLREVIKALDDNEELRRINIHIKQKKVTDI